jgi:hypothetical protein
VNIRFHVTSAGRRAFAQAIGEILGLEAAYDGTPNFTYTIGGYVIDRDGDLICPADADPDEADRLMAALFERGYEADKTPDYHTLQMTEREELGLGRERREDPQGENGMSESDVPDTITIELPFNTNGNEPLQRRETLHRLIGSKISLIQKALGENGNGGLPIEFTESGTVKFEWLRFGADSEIIGAWSAFLAAAVKHSMTAKRITATDKEVTNDKFTFRTFLVKIGMNDAEHKIARKLLLQNLAGDSAFATPESKAKWQAKHGKKSENGGAGQ